MERDWSGVTRGTVCRVCDARSEQVMRIEMAHIIPRRFDPVINGGTPSSTRVVDKLAVVPLCVTQRGGCHRAYDAGELDLLPCLTFAEQAFAVERVGLVTALRYISGRGVAKMILEDD